MSEGYKEDSTRGSSKVRPRNYKGDINGQAWLDSRVIATLDIWFDKKGFRNRFVSEVIKESLYMLCDALVDNGEVDMIEETHVARDYLTRKFRIDLNKRKGKRNVMHNTVLSSMRKKVDDVAKPIYNKECEYKGYVSSNELSDEEFQEIVKREWKKAQRNKELQDAEIERQKEEFRKSGNVIDGCKRSLVAPGERNKEQVAMENDLESQLAFLKNRVVKEE